MDKQPKLRFEIDKTFSVVCEVRPHLVTGEAYHMNMNAHGGGLFTPIAAFTAWQPVFTSEGTNAHWRVNCHVWVHHLAPDPAYIGKALAEALLARCVCSKPLWVSWFRSEELGGEAYGDLFGDD